MKKIVVAGSINVDIVSNMERYPKPGETLFGTGFGTFPGGKGANQGVAAGKLGGNVTFLGKVGDDIFGGQALKAFTDAGVDTSHIETEKNVNTGVACIWVNGEGENCIVLDPGANGLVDIDYVNRHLDAFEDCAAVLLQFEIPMETVRYIAEYCKGKGIAVILDPAPAVKVDEDLLKNVDFVTPNEIELLVASGCDNTEDAIRKLLDSGCRYVLNKRGPEGCILDDGKERKICGGFKVKPVDTTAAGDSFNAGFAVAWIQGKSFEEAMCFANATGAIAVTGKGAQSAMPTSEQVQKLIFEQRK